MMNRIKKLIIAVTALFTVWGCKDTDWAKDFPDYEIDGTIVSVDLLKSLHTGSDVAIEGDFRINGVVIFDAGKGKNVPGNLVFIQQHWKEDLRGIALEMPESQASTLKEGDSIVVKIKDKILTRTDGPLAIKGIKLKDMYKVAQYKNPVVRRVSVSELKNNFAKYESTLVRLDATLNPLPVGGESLEGSKFLEDESGSGMEMFTSSDAEFKDRGVPANATFEGLAYTAAQSDQLRLLSYDGVQNGSGPIYAGWPEGFDWFDTGSKGRAYNSGTNLMYFKTGIWWLYQSQYNDNNISANTNRDVVISPINAIRFQQNLTEDGFLQMNFDVPNGATKVTFYYGAYYTDPSSTFYLESSVDQGATWQRLSENISDARSFTTFGPSFASITCDFEGPVRFRIRKLGLGPTVAPGVLNGRLGIDDFAIYQKY